MCWSGVKFRVEDVQCLCAGSGMQSKVEGVQGGLGACACIQGLV